MILLSSNNFVYDEIHTDAAYIEATRVGRDINAQFPLLHVWLREFFQHNNYLTANQIGRNQLIEKVLKLVTYLMMYGYISSDNDINELMIPVLNIVSGFSDKPFEPDNRFCNFLSRSLNVSLLLC